MQREGENERTLGRYSSKSGKTVSKRVSRVGEEGCSLIQRLRGRSYRTPVEGIVEEREQLEEQLEQGEGG